MPLSPVNYAYFSAMPQQAALRFSSKNSAWQTQHFPVGFFYKHLPQPFELPAGAHSILPPFELRQHTRGRFFQLFANCILVEGQPYSALYDLQWQRIKPIPAVLARVLVVAQTADWETLKQEFPDYETGMRHYFARLAQEGFGFFTDKPMQFPPLVFPESDLSSGLQSLRLFWDGSSSFSLQQVLLEALPLGLRAVQLFFEKAVETSYVLQALERVLDSPLQRIEIFHPYISDFPARQHWQHILRQHVRVQRLVFYGAPRTCWVWNHHAPFAGRAAFVTNTEAEWHRQLTLSLAAFSAAQHAHLGSFQHMTLDARGVASLGGIAIGEYPAQDLAALLGNVRYAEAQADLLAHREDACPYRYACTRYGHCAACPSV